MDDVDGVCGLVGRRAELEALDKIIDGLGAGRGGFAEIRGDPGMGKSSLLAYAVRRAGRARVVCLTGRGGELESQIPFGVFADALDAHLAAHIQARDELRFLTRDGARDGAVDGMPGGLLAIERHRLFGAVKSLLEELAGRRPVLLALDDLHWVDEGSLELLGYLLRRPPRTAVVLMVAYRPRQASAALTAALGEAGRSPAVVHLGPLSRTDADILLGPGTGLAAKRALYRASGGNPFYLRTLAWARDETPAPEETPGRTAPAAKRSVPAEAPAPDAPSTGRRRPAGPDDPGAPPSAVRAALVSELRPLTQGARWVAAMAAILGDPFRLELLARVSGTPEAALLTALHELTVRDLVRPDDVPRQFRFRHPFVRHVAYELAGLTTRLRGHGRAAVELAALGAPPSALAHHVEQSAAVGDRRGFDVLVAAGAENAVPAPAVAAHWFRAALRLLPAGAEQAGERVDLLLRLAVAWAAAGRPADARTALDDALALVPRTETALRGELIVVCSRVEQLRGRYEESRRLLNLALDALPGDDSQVTAALRHELAAYHFYTGNYDEQLRVGREARGLAAAAPDESLLGATTIVVAGAEMLTGDIGAARELAAEAARLSERFDDDQLATRLEIWAWLGWCEVFLERFGEALCHLDRAARVARAAGQGHPLIITSVGHASAFLWQGRPAEAAPHVEAAIEGALLSGSDQFVAWAYTVGAWHARLTGDLGAAVRLGQRAARAAAAATDVMSRLAGCHLAEAHLDAGDPLRCRDLLLDTAGGAELPVLGRGLTPYWYEVLTRAELAAERVDAAAAWADRAAAAAAGTCLGGAAADALYARAHVLLARGKADHAAGAAVRGAATAVRAGTPIRAARGWALAGRALLHADRRREAVRLLARAEAEFRAREARHYQRQVAAERGTVGAGETSVRPVPLDRLTPRQTEVAGLVAAGLTNRQIARRLGLSENTVEVHLRRAYSRLEIGGRAALAAAVVRDSPM
ncbi:MAG TPA: AAA family ATPase [Streptosporangiaceae bacterium]|jgi:DNA-binding CsgD family transcriptional regulator